MKADYGETDDEMPDLVDDEDEDDEFVDDDDEILHQSYLKRNIVIEFKIN